MKDKDVLIQNINIEHGNKLKSVKEAQSFYNEKIKTLNVQITDYEVKFKTYQEDKKQTSDTNRQLEELHQENYNLKNSIRNIEKNKIDELKLKDAEIAIITEKCQ